MKGKSPLKINYYADFFPSFLPYDEIAGFYGCRGIDLFSRTNEQTHKQQQHDDDDADDEKILSANV